MTGERFVRRLAAILAADVAGYSRLWAATSGHASGAENPLSGVVDQRLRAMGRIVKTTDDGLLPIGQTGGAISHCGLHLDGTAHGVNDTWRTP